MQESNSKLPTTGTEIDQLKTEVRDLNKKMNDLCSTITGEMDQLVRQNQMGGEDLKVRWRAAAAN